MNPARHAHNRQRGQVLVIVAAGLIGLLAIAALVLEGGTMVVNRRDGQNSADLAAVSATRIVAMMHTNEAPFDTADPVQSDVFGDVQQVTADNGCETGIGVPCSWTASFVASGLADRGPVTDSGAAIPGDAVGVKVSVTRLPSAIMGRVIGMSTWTVSAEATAIAVAATSLPAGILLPIAVCGWGDATDCSAASPTNKISYQKDQVYDLTNGKDAPGGFAWLSWDGSNSAGALADILCAAGNPPFSLDDPFDSPGAPINGTFGTNPTTGETWFPIDPGKTNASDVRTCLDKWIGEQVLVPIYDLVVGTGNKAQYHITGVAAFVLKSRSQPAVDNIRGTFVGYYQLPAVPGAAGTLPPGAGDTTYFLGLVK